MPDDPFVREWSPNGGAKGCFLLLHGMESHSAWFERAARCLVSRSWAVLAPDRPGWGQSPGLRGDLESYRDFVALVSRLARRARERFGAVHLAGMSWGGLASLYFALRRGWLIDSLALLAPGVALKRGLPFSQALRTGYAFFTKNRQSYIEPRFTPELFSDQPGARAFVAGDRLRVRKVTASFCLETVKMRAFVRQTAGRRRLPPALCLLGRDDRMLDNRAAESLCRKAGCEVDVLAGAGHSLVLDCPDLVAGRLADHAESALARRANNRRRLWVIGGGAVGGTLAALASFAGHETGLLLRPSQLAAVKRRGFVLESGDAARAARENLVAADHPSALPPAPALAVLAVKSFDTEAALDGLKGVLPPDTVLASVQNGVANEQRIAGHFPDNPLAAAAICAGLEASEPGTALWPDDRGGLAAAAYRGDERLIRGVLEAILPDTGMEFGWIEGPNAAARLKWSKLMLNAAFNALNSLHGMSSAAILADPKLGNLALDALSEGFQVMDRLGLAPVNLPGYPVALLRLLVKAPRRLALKAMAWQAGRAAEAAFSMRQDVIKKRRRTEIDDLNGAIAAEAERLGVDAPANRELVRMVRENSE